MDDATRLKDYETSANEYWRWQNAGEDLLIASAILERSYNDAMKSIIGKTGGKMPLETQVLAPLIYCKAKALELYFKALYVKQGNPATDGKGMLANKMKTHKLVDLAGYTKVSLNVQQKQVLQQLTNAITHWGTYPIPARYTDWRPDVPWVTGIQPIFTWGPDANKMYSEVLVVLRKRLGT